MKNILQLIQITCLLLILGMIGGTLFSYSNDANWRGLTHDLMYYYIGLVGIIVVLQFVIWKYYRN